MNIEGLKTKRGNVEIRELVEEWDIVGLVETWLDEDYKGSWDGYVWFEKKGKRFSNKGRSSGGIMVLVKEKWKKKVKRIRIEEEGVIWILIEIERETLAVGITYNPPKGSHFEN